MTESVDPRPESGVTIVEPRRFSDSRGWFSETFVDGRLAQVGITKRFCQDNQSYSLKAGTIRGIHFQAIPHAQAKLVRCLTGAIVDYAVDLRRASPTFGRWVAAELSAENGRQLYVPEGFGHAFVTLEADCNVAYKVTDFYAPSTEGGVRWDDKDLAITWPDVAGAYELSDKDALLPTLKEMTVEFPYNGMPLAAIDGAWGGNI